MRRLPLFALLGCAACSVLVSLDDLRTSPTDGGSDVFVDGSKPACASDAGPQMLQATGFCIDSTEVTNADYMAFVNASSNDATSQPSVCAFNDGGPRPSTWSDAGYASGQDFFPVGGVNWCNAYAYCVWAGKHLCRSLQGTAIDFTYGNANPARNNAAIDEWYVACSSSGATTYPYGNSFESTYCNNFEYETNPLPVQVATLPQCVGGLPNLHDMSGNVAEWEDSCQSENGSNDPCSVRGGSFLYSDSADDGGVGHATKCTDLLDEPRGSGFADVGFRCCKED